MNKALSQVLSHTPGAKPAQDSASLQGLAVAAAAPVVVPLIASWFGLSETDSALVFQYFITVLGALWGLFGVLRRSDIRLPGQK